MKMIVVTCVTAGLSWIIWMASTRAQEPASPVMPRAPRTMPTLTDFGAIGDGVTDDTRAIQAALDSGYGVLVPPGDYRFTQDVVLRSGGGLTGIGFHSHFKGENAGIVASPRLDEPYMPFWMLRDIRISRGGDLPGPALSIVGNSAGHAPVRAHIDGLIIEGSSGDGIRLANSYLIYITSPIIRRCAGAGIVLNATPNASATANAVTIHGGEIQSCQIGIDATGVMGLLLSGTTIEGNSQSGVVLRRLCRSVMLLGCYFEFNGSKSPEGADVLVGTEGKCYGVTIDNCNFSGHVDDVQAYAIRMLNCDNAIVEGGWAARFTRAFVYVDARNVTGHYTDAVLRSVPTFAEPQSAAVFRPLR